LYNANSFVIIIIIKDFIKANQDYSATILRYFNPIGAHLSGLTGESPLGVPNNLMPSPLQQQKVI